MNIPNSCELGRIPEGFNWFEVLKDLEQGDELSDKNYYTLTTMAGNWPTCACGQLCQALERNELGAPVDETLKTHGIKFAHLVRAKRWTCATHTMNQIEARTTELLAQLPAPSAQCGLPG